MRHGTVVGDEIRTISAPRSRGPAMRFERGKAWTGRLSPKLFFREGRTREQQARGPAEMRSFDSAWLPLNALRMVGNRLTQYRDVLADRYPFGRQHDANRDTLCFVVMGSVQPVSSAYAHSEANYRCSSLAARSLRHKRTRQWVGFTHAAVQ